MAKQTSALAYSALKSLFIYSKLSLHTLVKYKLQLLCEFIPHSIHVKIPCQKITVLKVPMKFLQIFKWPAIVLHKENHAIVAWFKRMLLPMYRKKNCFCCKISFRPGNAFFYITVLYFYFHLNSIRLSAQSSFSGVCCGQTPFTPQPKPPLQQAHTPLFFPLLQIL